MQLSTLVKRYQKFGYEPLGLERDFEVTNIIKWIYEKHDIYINIQYCSLRFPEYLKFTPFRILNVSTEESHTFYSDKSLKNPFDAMFVAVTEAYVSVKNFEQRLKYSNIK